MPIWTLFEEELGYFYWFYMEIPANKFRMTVVERL